MNKDKFPDYSLGDKIHIVGRSVQVTDAMKNHALEKFSKIERFHNHIMDIHVVMDIVHLEHTVTIVAHFDHFRMKAHASSSDMYVSIDQAIERLQSQFRRWKDRMQDYSHKRKPIVEIEIDILERLGSDLQEFNEEIVEQNKKSKDGTFPSVTGRRKVLLKELTANEAIMKMELSGDQFMVYRSEEDRKLKVMYRRKDGSYGIIQPE